jgi:hypothetical protein
MITNRHIQESDYTILEQSLAADNYHQRTTIDFFKEEGTVTNVYLFDDELILFARGKPILTDAGTAFVQLDIQFLNNENRAKNLIVMLTGFYELEQKCRAEGFAGFVFNSDVPLLRKFCIRRLGFSEYIDDFLVKVFEQVPIDIGPGVEV